jgi:hypothetical protein
MNRPKPATGGRSPASQRPDGAPDPANENELLDEALEESFPASDPPQPAQPGVTGWDLDDEEKEGAKKR